MRRVKENTAALARGVKGGALIGAAVAAMALGGCVPTGFLPWLTASGVIPAWRSRRTCRNAAPLGAHAHLWKFPVV